MLRSSEPTRCPSDSSRDPSRARARAYTRYSSDSFSGAVKTGQVRPCMLRILMVCPQFSPMLGGYEQAAERLSHELSRRGHQVSVVTERRLKTWPKREQMGQLDVRRLWCSTRRGMHSTSSIVSFVLFLAAHGRSFDVIHVHQYGWYSSIAIAFGLVSRRPVVLKLTGTGPLGIVAVLSRMPFSRLHVGLHRRLPACNVTSERARAEALTLGVPDSHVHVIPNGLDTCRFRPPSREERAAARRQLGLGEGFLALTVCRLRPEKDLVLLLDAWRRVLASGGDIGIATLAIVGGGHLFDSLRQHAAERGVDSSTRMPGDTPDPLPWYHAADLYIVSSKNEGLSNSLMEAVASGLAFVSTRVSGSEDILADADAGEGVPVGDADALAAAVERLARNPERRTSCGLRGRAYAERNYSLQSVASRIEALYYRLCRDVRHRGDVT